MKKIVLILCLIVFVTWGCRAPGSSEKVTDATYQYVQDNDKNIFWVDTWQKDKSIALIQNWIDKHPTKRIVSIGSQSTGAYGWLVIYEDRAK